MPVAFVPLTQAPTHLGAFLQPVTTVPVLAAPSFASFGQPFVVTIEAAFGANLAANPSGWTWTNISADARVAQGVTARRGRVDENSQTAPTQVTFALNNFNGQYTPRNALGANYPYIRQNLPFRVSINDGTENSVRGVVYADTFTAGWDPSLNLPIVTVSASGVLRRLAQGGSLRSALYRSVSATNPVAYWALEDASASTAAASGISGGTALAVTGSPRFGAIAQPGSANILDLSAGGSLGAAVPPGSFTNAWRIEWVGTYPTTKPTAGQTGTAVQFHTTGTYSRWGFNTTGDISPVTINIFWEKPDGTGNTAIVSNTQVHDGVARHFRIDAFQSGANIDITLSVNGVSAGHYVGGLSAGTLGRIVDVQLNPGGAAAAYLPSVGHLAVWQPYIGGADTAAASTGYAGELASARVSRVGTELGVAVTIVGTSTSAVGAQSIAKAPDLMREAEAVDGGVLSDGLTAGVKLLTAPARYNRPPDLAIDAALGQLPPGFAPVEDDQRRRNDWTATRTNSGSSGHVIDTYGPQGTNAVGTYADAVTVNTSTDAALINQAGWRVRLGTVEAMRYPTVPLNLRANPELAIQWRGCDIGSRFTLRNLPSQHQPGDVDLVIEGYTEFCDGQQWLVGINSSPFDPWRVFVIGDPVLGKIDADGSILHSPLAALATGTVDSFTVDVMAGQLWTTTATFPADFPFDINIDGERITVTGITGTSSPQTFNVTRATNGVVRAHNVGAAVSLWTKPGIAL